ncbi:oligosaccharide flippase family protein [Corynebacterium ammoniagenes]|uniref:Polysaccharide biosynthesis protein n=1 Tax=Corynebacterium ammoniagenes TaxID=1697 RepID=A0AAV5G1L3_CORAM|nr:oligosaccharide flippase family protein [Corynebacterium ammoniagenes]GJN42009.1 hypothetical protein CAT723_04880 [Corynebacterium ammoniagenes]
MKNKWFNLTNASGFLRSAYFQSMVIRISNALLAFGVAVLMARLLGPDEYGKYAIILSLATILGIPFKAGLPRTMTRDIAIARTSSDPGRVRAIIRFGAIVFLLLIPLVILVAVCIWIVGYEVAGVALGVVFAGVLAPIFAANSNRMAVMRGLGSAIRSQIPDMLIQPLGTAIIVVALITVLGTASAEVGLIAYAASTILGVLVGVLMVRSDIKQIPDIAPANNFKRSGFLGSVATMSLLGAATSITGNIDMLLLNHFGAYSDAGYYKVALSGLAVVVLGGNAVSAVAFTRLAESIPSGDLNKIAAQSDKALIWSSLFTGGVTVLVLILGRPVINLFFGEEYSDAWPILLVLSIGFTVAFLFGQGPDLASLSGAQVPAAFCILIGIVVTIGFAIGMQDSLGVMAIALGSMIGTITRFVLTSFVVRFSIKIDISIFGFIYRLLKNRTREG